jgi:hypothetical protein
MSYPAVRKTSVPGQDDFSTFNQFMIRFEVEKGSNVCEL